MAPKNAIAEDESHRDALVPQPSKNKARKPKRSSRTEEGSGAFFLGTEDSEEQEASIPVRLLSTVPGEASEREEEESGPQWEIVDEYSQEESAAESRALVPTERPKPKRRAKTRVIVQKKNKKPLRSQKKKKSATHQEREWEPNLKQDLLGLTLFAIGILASLALLSHQPEGLISLSLQKGATQNWIGPLGAFLADGLTLGFGFAAYGVPLALLYSAVLCLRRTFRRPPGRRIAGWVLMGMGATCFLEIAFGDAPGSAYPPGGALGLLMSTTLLPYLYPIGTGIFSLLLCTAGALIALDRSFGEGLAICIDRVESLRFKVREHFDVWIEERRILKEEGKAIKDSLKETLQEEEKQKEKEAQKEFRKRQKEERENRIREKATEKVRHKIAAELDEDAKNVKAPIEPPPIIVGGSILPKANVKEVDIDLQEPAWVDHIEDRTDVAEQIGSLVIKSEAQDENAKRKRGGNNASRKSETRDTSLPRESPSALKSDDDREEFRIVERDVEIGDDWDTGRPALVSESKFELPPLNMLNYDAPQIEPADPEKMMELAEKLTEKFLDFGIQGRMREVRPGPVVTTYEFIPAPGIKVSRIAALADDIAMAMEAVHVRIVAPIPGKGAVGIEIPNEKRETVFLKEIIASDEFRESSNKKLMMALGKDIQGNAYHADLAEMPHVLISGTTGSGKSVSVNAMICSILYRATPSEVKFLMIDPKMLELSIYDGIPHLLLPPIVDSKKAGNALQWAVSEMERRYQAMSEMGVRDIEGFGQLLDLIQKGKDPQNRKAPKDAKGNPIAKFPYIVVVIDEYADLLAIAGKEVETHIMRLAQKARAAGIHVMLATQRPSVDVITGVIKANFPVRMGFRLASVHDSKTIINRKGAEKLLGRGDMLIMPAGTSNVTRIHGAYISEKELYRVIEFLKKQGKAEYDLSIIAPPPDAEGELGLLENEEKDKKFDTAVQVVARSRKCSTSWLQRQLGVGYNRAARMVEMMEHLGLVGPALNAKGERKIFITPES